MTMCMAAVSLEPLDLMTTVDVAAYRLARAALIILVFLLVAVLAHLAFRPVSCPPSIEGDEPCSPVSGSLRAEPNWPWK